MPVTHAVLVFMRGMSSFHVVRPDSRMIDFHSSIDFPYICSIDGKYDAGPLTFSVADSVMSFSFAGETGVRG